MGDLLEDAGAAGIPCMNLNKVSSVLVIPPNSKKVGQSHFVQQTPKKRQCNGLPGHPFQK